MIFLLTNRISGCLCLAHDIYIVKIRINSLSVFFWDEVHLPIFQGSCLNLELLRVLLIIWIAVWQYFSEFFFLRKQISLLINESSCWNLRLCSFSWPFRFQIVIFIYIFTLIFILRQIFIFLFFKEAVQIWSLCKFSWPCGLQSGSIL